MVLFHLVPGSTGDQKTYNATYGKSVIKNQTFFGCRFSLLITMSGAILDFELVSVHPLTFTERCELFFFDNKNNKQWL
jgi:hypothetical protein